MTPYLYIAPAVLLFLALVIGPFLHSAWLSLYRWDGISQPEFTGLDNYVRLLSDSSVQKAFAHSIVLVVFFVTIPLAAGLIVASAMVTARVRGSDAMRTIIFLPQVLSMVVIGVSWNWVLASGGPFNQLLSLLGLADLRRAWLGDFFWALPSVGLIGAWAMIGLFVVLLMAAMQQVSPSLYDACRVDGGGRFRELIHVTIPGVRGQIAILLTISIVAALRSFDIVFVTTQAGPGTSTVVPGYLLYQRGFISGDIGSATAIGVILTVLVFGAVLLVNRVVAR